MKQKSLIDSLSSLLEVMKKEIDRPGGKKWCPMATVSPEGFPQNRYIILRSMDLSKGHFIFYTHAQSRKVADLETSARAVLCWYLQSKRLQLQFFCTPKRITQTKELRTYWKTLYELSHKDYQGPPPGSPASEALSNPDSSTKDSERHFAAFRLYWERIEALELRKEENQRRVYVRHQSDWDSFVCHP